MAKIDLTSVMGGFRTQAQINQNFASIEQAFDNTLSRNGSLPNQMEADIDMNSNDILNVKQLSVDNLVIGGSATLPVLVSRSQETQNPGVGDTALAVNSYYVGNDSLSIYVDGLKYVVDVDYTEVGDANSISNSVNITAPFAGTETVDIIIDATYQKGECSANPAIVNWVSIADYICAGDDDDTALASAISDACTENRSIYIPAGVYSFDVTKVITNCNMSIYGDGPGKSILRFNGVDGFHCNYSGTDVFRRFSIQDLSLIQDDATTGSAIVLNNAGPAEGYHTIISNIDFVDTDPATGDWRDHSWEHGVYITGVDDGTIEKCIFLSDITPADPTSFVYFAADTSLRWNITDNHIGWCDRAIEFATSATDWHELITISNNKITTVDYAVYHDYTCGDWQVLNLNFDNNTVKMCQKDGIYMCTYFSNIHDNIIVHDPSVYGAGAGTYSIINLYGSSQQNRVHDNFIGNLPSAPPYTAYGVTLDGTCPASPQEYNVVENNTINYTPVGIFVDNDVTASRWQRNIYGGFVTTYISDNTASSDRNYHGNGDTTKYKVDTPVDITTAVSPGTSYKIVWESFDNSKNDLDLDAVPVTTINIPDYVNRIRVTANVIIQSDGAPTPGTLAYAQIIGTGVDGNPLPQFVAGQALTAPGSGDLVVLTLVSAALDVVAGSTFYIQTYSDAAWAKSVFDAYFYIENIT